MDSLRKKLGQYCRIDDPTWCGFADLAFETKVHPRDSHIVRVGEPADTVHVIEEGWAIRYRRLEDGRRQITNFMLPGDVFDLQALGRLEADHSIIAVTHVRALELPSRNFIRALTKSGRVASAMWWAAVQEESILREQIIRIGRRTARERIGHLLLELQRRAAITMGGEDEAMRLPITRTDLADALGLTPVHVSRTMSALKKSGLIEESKGVIRIVDRKRLQSLAHFDAGYLHDAKLSLVEGDDLPFHHDNGGETNHRAAE